MYVMVVAGNASVQGALGIREANKTVSKYPLYRLYYIDFTTATELISIFYN